LWNGLIIEVIKMVYAAQIAGHIVITLVALFGLALRIEHRLTKIETDVTWLKDRNVSSKDD